jgi:hypothetical protein
MKLSERIQIDDASDEVTVDGVRFSGEVLTQLLSGPTPPGRWYRITDVRDGRVVIMEKVDEDFPK